MVTNVTTPVFVGLNFFVDVLKSTTDVAPSVKKFVVKILLSVQAHAVNQPAIVSMVLFVIATENVFTKMTVLYVRKMNSLKMENASVQLVLTSMRMVYVKSDLGRFSK